MSNMEAFNKIVSEIGKQLNEETITAIKAALLSQSDGEAQTRSVVKDEPEQMAKLGWQVIDCPICGEGARAFPKQEAKDDLLEAVQFFLNWSDSVYYGEDTSRELENAKDKARAAIARAIEAAHGIKETEV